MHVFGTHHVYFLADLEGSAEHPRDRNEFLRFSRLIDTPGDNVYHLCAEWLHFGDISGGWNFAVARWVLKAFGNSISDELLIFV